MMGAAERPPRRQGAVAGEIRDGALTARISPATEAIIETSSNSDGDSGGRIDGSRAASIDLPAPGEPIMSK